VVLEVDVVVDVVDVVELVEVVVVDKDDALRCRVMCAPSTAPVAGLVAQAATVRAKATATSANGRLRRCGMNYPQG
jgi:hypothetical protein